MVDVVFTTQPVISPPMPLPVRSYVDFETSKAAPLVLQVSNCADFKVGTTMHTVYTAHWQLGLHAMLQYRHGLLVGSAFSSATVAVTCAAAGGLPGWLGVLLNACVCCP